MKQLDSDVIPLSQIDRKEMEWLWRSRIPLGCITLLESEGGSGKSTITCALGSAISRGKAMPGGEARNPANVLVFAAEDDPAVVLRPRFEDNGADLERILIKKEIDIFLDPNGIKRIEKMMEQFQPLLVIIDPIVSFLGAGLDANKATDVRSVMRPLHSMAARFNCAILIVRHWNKSAQASASQRGSGSVDFRNAARSVLQVIKTDETTYLALEKSNYDQRPPTLTFKIEGKTVKWTGEIDISPDEILKTLRSDSVPDRKLDDAKDFLTKLLRNRPLSSDELFQRAASAGFSKATINRAKEGVARSVKLSSVWYWELESPEVRNLYAITNDQVAQVDQPSQTSFAEKLENLDNLGSARSL